MSALARIPRRKVPALCAKEKFSVVPGHLSPALRKRISVAIDALLAVLDADDPDPDLEPEVDLEDDNDQDVSEERHHA